MVKGCLAYKGSTLDKHSLVHHNTYGRCLVKSQNSQNPNGRYSATSDHSQPPNWNLDFKHPTRRSKDIYPTQHNPPHTEKQSRECTMARVPFHAPLPAQTPPASPKGSPSTTTLAHHHGQKQGVPRTPTIAHAGQALTRTPRFTEPLLRQGTGPLQKGKESIQQTQDAWKQPWRAASSLEVPAAPSSASPEEPASSFQVREEPASMRYSILNYYTLIIITNNNSKCGLGMQL